MLLSALVITPLLGIILILLLSSYDKSEDKKWLKFTALLITSIDLIISLIILILFNNSSKYFQFVQEQYTISHYDFYLGIDGLSIYFVLLTTIIIPISIISNWKSIKSRIIYFLTITLLLEALLLLIYMVLDLLMFYIFFESILAPLFILIGIFGSIEKQRASFYFFLYTFLGSLFMLLSIITVSYLSGCTDINIISKNGFIYITQLWMFIGIFTAFAVKTPVIYLNGWLLKAHVESPLSGSIILAAVVLKLSLYGIFRLILILSPKAYLACTYVIFTIGIITIIYASLSTLRTVDIKELIAYSSVSHAAVYFVGVFSNVIQGILGGICLGLAHGFVSSGLFTIAGGTLYDRSNTRLISCYKGLVQAMPLFSILFFILALGNCGAPLTLNFVGEFMSLYGVFERLPLAGVLGSSSIVFSAAFTIFMFNRIVFGGSLYKWNWIEYISDLNLREYSILLVLVIFTVLFGIYPSVILDGLGYVGQGLIFSFDTIIKTNFSPEDVIGQNKWVPLPKEVFPTFMVNENKIDLDRMLLERNFTKIDGDMNNSEEGKAELDRLRKNNETEQLAVVETTGVMFDFVKINRTDLLSPEEKIELLNKTEKEFLEQYEVSDRAKQLTNIIKDNYIFNLNKKK